MHAFLLFCPSSFNSDGLYVLLRPIAKKGKKNKGAPNQPADLLSHPSIPSNLVDYVMTELPAGTCPWGISGGPQFPRPTAIQKRYCYPKVCIWCYLFSFILFSVMIQRWLRFLTLALAFVILHIFFLPRAGPSTAVGRQVHFGQCTSTTGRKISNIVFFTFTSLPRERSIKASRCVRIWHRQSAVPHRPRSIRFPTALPSRIFVPRSVRSSPTSRRKENSDCSRRELSI